MSTITEEQVVAWMRDRLANADQCSCLSLSVSSRYPHAVWYMHGPEDDQCVQALGTSDECAEKLSAIIPTPEKLAEARARKAAELRRQADELEASV